MKRALLAALLLPTWLWATPFSTDWTDVWLSPSESGWGMTTFQQDDTIFVTFYIYGTSGTPTWYVGSGLTYNGNVGTSQVFRGPLYETRGSYFPAPWSNSSTPPRQVGTVTLTFTSIQQASLTYTVDGATVSKAVQRYAFKANSMAGTYIGASVGTYSSGCGAATGYAEEAAIFTITHSANGFVAITGSFASGVTCTYSGNYGQGGRFGFMNGNLACSNGASGTFSAGEIDSGLSALTVRANATYLSLPGCSWSGKLGGLRRGS